MSGKSQTPHVAHQPIPGERDPDNLTTREPGAVGGRFTGADIPPDAHQPWLDDVTAEEHAREGGKEGLRPKAEGRRKA